MRGIHSLPDEITLRSNDRLEQGDTVLPRLLLQFVVAICAIPAAPADELVTLETRPGVKQRFLFFKPEHPAAAVLIAPGGTGNLNLNSFFGAATVGHNGFANHHFLVNRRDDFKNAGLMIAVIDTPSDRGLMNWAHRMSDEHADDLKAVVAYLKSKADVPVWLVGDSASAFSLANAALRLGNDISGLVFASSVTHIPTNNPYSKTFAADYPEGVMSVKGLEGITQPVLVVSHQDDQCFLSPAANSERLAARFPNARKVEVRYLEGGNGMASGRDACVCPSTHCFTGIQKDANSIITSFIKSN